ncbi:MAG: NYN domain-containing protein [Capsulimonadaceae bacterium]
MSGTDDSRDEPDGPDAGLPLSSAPNAGRSGPAAFSEGRQPAHVPAEEGGGEAPSREPPGHEGAEPDDDAGSPQVGPKERALRWLQTVRPSTFLAILRHPEAEYLTARAFSGFRVNTRGLASPIVRSRLAALLSSDPSFFIKMQELVAELDGSVVPSSVEPDAEEPAGDDERARPAQPAPAFDVRVRDLEGRLDRERHERRQLQSESRATAERMRQVERDLQAARATNQAMARERDAARSALDQTSQRLARLERRCARLTIERDLLLKASERPAADSAEGTPVRSDRRGARAIQFAAVESMVNEPSAFEAAAMRLLTRGDAESALYIAEDVLRIEPANLAGLELAASANRDLGRGQQAAAMDRDLLSAALAASDLRRATDAFLAVVTVSPEAASQPRFGKPYAAALRAASAADLAALSGQLGRLSSTHPEAFNRISALIQEYTPAGVADRVLQREAFDIAGVLPLDIPTAVTARAVVNAVNAGDTALIDLVRAALATIRNGDNSRFVMIQRAVADAAGGDDAYLSPLLQRSRGHVVVDASNVAWHDEASGIGERPRLAPLLQLRSTLLQRGYFPVHLVGDAPLPHTIDDPRRLREMMQRQEISLVMSGTDADEVLIREARRLHAPIVTNDYMADWDPEGTVHKIRFAIPASGPAFLLA